MEEIQKPNGRFVILEEAILNNPNLTPTEKLVYGRICTFDVYFESAETTAKIVGASAGTVRNAKQRLSKLGLIKCIENTGRGKKWVPTYITLHNLVDSDSMADSTIPCSQTQRNNVVRLNDSVDSDSTIPCTIVENIEKNIEKNLHTYASSADATLAGADKKEPTEVQSAVDVDSSLSTLKNIYSGHSAKTQKTASILQQVIDIINPAQKITDTRLRALNARLKEYSVDEVLAAAERFAKDEWRNRPENKKFKSVDYLLMPSKFSRWAEATDEGANEKPKSESISVKY